MLRCCSADTELVFPHGMILAVPCFLKRSLGAEEVLMPFIRINSVLKLQILF